MNPMRHNRTLRSDLTRNWKYEAYGARTTPVVPSDMNPQSLVSEKGLEPDATIWTQCGTFTPGDSKSPKPKAPHPTREALLRGNRHFSMILITKLTENCNQKASHSNSEDKIQRLMAHWILGNRHTDRARGSRSHRQASRPPNLQASKPPNLPPNLPPTFLYTVH